jgi:hypothetical protein
MRIWHNVSISSGREKEPWHTTKSIEGARLQKGKGRISPRLQKEKEECHLFPLDCRAFVEFCKDSISWNCFPEMTR